MTADEGDVTDPLESKVYLAELVDTGPPPRRRVRRRAILVFLAVLGAAIAGIGAKWMFRAVPEDRSVGQQPTTIQAEIIPAATVEEAESWGKQLEAAIAARDDRAALRMYDFDLTMQKAYPHGNLSRTLINYWEPAHPVRMLLVHARAGTPQYQEWLEHQR